MNRGISTENLMRKLPGVLARDATMNAFCKVLSEELVLIVQEMIQATLYSRIDELPEEVLDTFAYDFKVDWYDYDSSIEVKRNLIKDCVNVHRRLGTRYAVETAVGDLYADADVEEWFEYGGDAFRFRIRVNGKWTGEQHTEDVLRTINMVKSRRSWLDEITFTTKSDYSSPLRLARALLIGGAVTIKPWAYEMPQLSNAARIAHALSIHGTTTINRGE